MQIKKLKPHNRYIKKMYKYSVLAVFFAAVSLLVSFPSFAQDAASNNNSMGNAAIGNAVGVNPGDGAESSVAQFQQWLLERDEQNQQMVANAASNQQASNSTANSSNSSSSGELGEADIDQLAFQELKEQTMPMSAAQMQEFKKLVQESARVTASSIGTPPKPVSATLNVSLSPGTTPPAVRLTQGFITSLVFVDSSGAPWPIASFDIGNPNAFNVQWDKVSNILLIQPIDAYTYANLAIRLQGLSTPVMLTLVPGQAEVDYRVDLRISGVGPNSTGQSTAQALPQGADPVLLDVLDGIPPSGSTELTVRGVQGQAWSVGDVLYLRMKPTVLSPGWIDQMSSPDGTHAYALPITPSVLISYYGKPVEIQIEDNTSEQTL